MCKLLIMTKTEQVQQDGRLDGLIKYAAELVGSSELDGFGYVLGNQDDGTAVIERSLEVGRRFRSGLTFGPDGTVTERGRPTAAPFLIPREASEAVFTGTGAGTGGGPQSRKVTAGPLILHGRTSTNADGLLNTHPMVIKDTILCHNGVVTYSGPKYKKATGNDSEDLTFAFRKFGLKGAAKRLSGYYAFGALNTKDRTLTVVRDAIASLHGVWLPKADSWCFGTSAAHVHAVASFLGEAVTLSDVTEFKKDYSVTFSYSGEVLANGSFHSRGYTAKEASKASRSLGHSLDSGTSRTSAGRRSRWSDDEPASLYETYEGYSSVYSASDSIINDISAEDGAADEPLWLDFSAEDIRRYLIENQDDESVAFWFYETKDTDGTRLVWDEFIELTDEEQARCVIETRTGNYIDCAPLRDAVASA